MKDDQLPGKPPGAFLFFRSGKPKAVVVYWGSRLRSAGAMTET